MAYFDFSRLINKYSSEFKVLTYKDGYYNKMGDWVDGEETEITLSGAIISHKESKIYRSEGTLTADDKRLFTLQPIDEALKGSKIVYEDKVYRIEDNSDNSKFTNCYAYTLKYVSAFKGDSGND